MSCSPDQDETPPAKNVYEEQDAWGNSIASLRANLKLTMVERLRKAEAAERFFHKYRGVVHRKPKV